MKTQKKIRFKCKNVAKFTKRKKGTANTYIKTELSSITENTCNII